MASFSRGLSHVGLGSHAGLGRHVGLSSLAGARAPPFAFVRTFASAPLRLAKFKSPKKRPSPYAKPVFAGSTSPVPARIIVPTKSAAVPKTVAAKTVPKTVPKTVVQTVKTANTVTAPPRSTYAEQLGLRAAPTLLYEAPSHTWYRFITTSLGVTFITYSVLNYWDIYLNAPADIMWWVPYAFAGICAFMAAFGAYMFRGTHGIVRTIRAVPTAHALQGARAKQVAAVVQDTGAPIVLELTVSRMVPVLPVRTRYVLPGALVLPARLAAAGLSESATGAFGATPQVPDSLKERVLSRRAEEERRRAAREYEMNHLMTAPFRHAGQGASTAWKHVMRAFSHEGFMRATEQATGKRHKIDITGGWALDNGRALDRLVTVFDDE